MDKKKKVDTTNINLLIQEIKEIHNISLNTLNNLNNTTYSTINRVLDKAEHFEETVTKFSTIKNYFKQKIASTPIPSTPTLTLTPSFTSSSATLSTLSSSTSSISKKVPSNMCAYCAKHGHWVGTCPHLKVSASNLTHLPEEQRNLCFNCWDVNDIHKAKDCPLRIK
ncbi:unnamed protein product [Rhizophagus irregularis]|nr:unnamed protein product [Rhizophagus irregularis]